MRIAAIDFETSHLNANMGRILCASFMPIYNAPGMKATPYTFRADDKKYKRKDLLNDRALCEAIRDELEHYHLIVTWNGKLFDVPFLNARLAKFDSRRYEPTLHADMMWYAAGNSNRIGSRKLDNVQKFFGFPEKKTEITWEDWQRANALVREGMDRVVEHCEADVRVLEAAYWKLLPAVKNIHR
jgi:uncharacterized protein YprB with RNaseH-like and TPR domain